MISAVIGIFIFLFGDFGETEAKLLLTTLTIGGFSLTGLCSSTIHNRMELKAFSLVGMLVSVLGFLITICVIWEIIDIKDTWKTMIVFIILAVTIGHISLLFIIKPKSTFLKNILRVTILFISIVAIMLITLILADADVDGFFFRLLGVFAILDVLGTVATPIINKMQVK